MGTTFFTKLILLSIIIVVFLGKVVFVFVFFTFQNTVAEADKPAVLIFLGF